MSRKADNLHRQAPPPPETQYSSLIWPASFCSYSVILYYLGLSVQYRFSLHLQISTQAAEILPDAKLRQPALICLQPADKNYSPVQMQFPHFRTSEEQKTSACVAISRHFSTASPLKQQVLPIWPEQKVRMRRVAQITSILPARIHRESATHFFFWLTSHWCLAFSDL